MHQSDQLKCIFRYAKPLLLKSSVKTANSIQITHQNMCVAAEIELYRFEKGKEKRLGVKQRNFSRCLRCIRSQNLAAQSEQLPEKPNYRLGYIQW